MRNKRKMGYVFLMFLLILCCSSTTVFAADTSAEYVPQLYATIWSLVPPVVAIVLALITKEVYSSLFVGILIGGAFWSGFKPEATILHVFQDGVVGVLTDSYNMGILVFLVILGVMVCMMNKAGGSAAFGRWAKEHIKTRQSQCIPCETRISDRCYSSANLHYCTDFFLGSSSNRICERGGWIFNFYSCNPI